MRKYYIDRIRTVTIILVVVYHIIYMFNSVVTGGVIGPIMQAKGLNVIQYLLYPWFMVILFLLSGMCSNYYLQTHTAKEYVSSRTRKLLVPSTIGILVFGWAQGYINMAISHAFETMSDQIPGAVSYLIMCVSGTGVLWTIQVMWIFSMLLILVRKIEKGYLQRAGKKLGIIGLVLLGILAWGAAQILNTPVIAVYRFGIYGFAFFAGYFIFAAEEVTDTLKKYALWLVGAACILGILYAWHDYGNNYAVEPSVNSPLAVAYGWMTCLAMLGAMKRFGNNGSRFLTFMTKKSFGLYVFHYLALSACAYYLTQYTRLPGGVIYILTALAAFLGGLALYEIISRIPVLRFCILGMKGEKKNVL